MDSNKTFVKFLLSGLALLWLAGVSIYFLVGSSGSLHPEIFLAFGERLLQVFLAVLIFLVAYFPGKGILKLFPVKPASALEEYLFSQGIGLWLISVLVLVSGRAGILTRGFYLLIFAGILASSRRQIVSGVKSLLGAKPEVDPADDIFPRWLITLLVLPFLLLALSGSLTPPMSYDALEYHLGAPAAYLKAGRIAFLEGNVYSNFPALVEMLYLLGLILKDDLVAKLVHFLLGAASALAVFNLARSLFSRRTAFLAAFIFLSYAQVNLLASQAYVDLGVTFFSVLALTAFIRWIGPEKKSGWLMLSGVLCGIACCCKYSSFLFTFLALAAGVLLFSVLGWVGKEKWDAPGRGIRWRSSLRKLFVFALLTAVMVTPWLGKNLFFTGNPVYPFAFGIFGGRDWSNIQAAEFIAHHTSSERNIVTFFSTPFTAAFSDNLMSPLFLLFSPFAFLWFRQRKDFSGAGGRKRMLAVLCGYVFLYYFLWYSFTHRNPRFFVPAAAVISVLAAAGFDWLSRLGKVRILAGAVLFAASGYNLFTCALVQAERSPLPVITGFETRDEFLLRELPHYSAVKFMNGKLGKEAKILFVGEARTYYTRKEIIANTVFDNSIIAEMIKNCSRAEEILPRLEARGVTHVFVNLTEVSRLNDWYGYLDDFNWELFRELEEKYLEPVFVEKQKGLFVYRVKYLS